MKPYFVLLFTALGYLLASNTYAIDVDWQAYFHERQRLAQAHTLENGGESFYDQLALIANDQGPVNEASFRGVLNKLAAREDASDFRASILIRWLYQFSHSDLVSPELKADIEQTLLDFKYWVDEPGQDPMIFWSENHLILFLSTAYLVGQYYPERIFSNSGLTGEELQSKAKPLLNKWLSLRARTGFAEWHSNNYYEEDIGPLLNLVDFAEDPVMRQNAAAAVDLLLLDLALYSHGGAFAGSHGRTFSDNLLDPRNEATHSTANLVFGQSVFTRTGGVSFTPLSLTENYVPPGAIVLIGRKDWHEQYGVASYWNDWSRMGLFPEEAEALDLEFSGDEDYNTTMFWWAAGAYAQPFVLDNTLWALDNFKLYERNKFFSPLKSIKFALKARWIDNVIARVPFFQSLADIMALLGTQTAIHHKPNVVLSSAIEKFPGQPSAQNHAWSAVLDGSVQVFTSHPLTDGSSGDYFGYFTGGASLPRIAQYEDVALILYNPNVTWWQFLFPNSKMTHAYFPFHRFDETEQRGHWFFGRKGEGYIAMYSHNPPSKNQGGPLPNEEIVASGAVNIWICEIGDATQDGSFQSFIQRVSNQPVSIDLSQDLQVSYGSDLGTMEYSWSESLQVNQQTVLPEVFPRYNNPFVSVPWGDTTMDIHIADETHRIEFDFAGENP